MENYVTYAYEDVTVDGKKAEKVTATMKDGSTSVVIKDLNGNTLSTILGGETANYTYDNKNRLTAISGRLDSVNEPFSYNNIFAKVGDVVEKYCRTIDYLEKTWYNE